MSSPRIAEALPASRTDARLPQPTPHGARARGTAPPDPAGQSPDDPIEFTAGTDVARGNEERANAEPEPPALHDAHVAGEPDAYERRHPGTKAD